MFNHQLMSDIARQRQAELLNEIKTGHLLKAAGFGRPLNAKVFLALLSGIALMALVIVQGAIA